MMPVLSRPAAQWNSVATPAGRFFAMTSKVPFTAARPVSRLPMYTLASSTGSSDGNGSCPSLPSTSTGNREDQAAELGLGLRPQVHDRADTQFVEQDLGIGRADVVQRVAAVDQAV